MPETPPPYRRFCIAVSATAISISAAALLGYMVHIPRLVTAIIDMPAITANGAGCTLLVGAALWLTCDTAGWRRQAARSLLATVVIVIVMTGLEYLLAANQGIDRLLFVPLPDAYALAPGRMNPIGCGTLLLLSVALLLIDTSWRRASQIAAAIAFLLGFLVIVDYLDGAKSIMGVSRYTIMGVNESLACTLLGLGVLFARPRQAFMELITAPTAGGLTTRRLLLAGLLLPPLAMFLRLQGEWNGLYDRDFGGALFTLANVIGFALVIYYNACSYRKSEIVIEARTGELEAANHELQQLDRMKSEFLATMSHELLTPLNAIMGFSDLMLDEQAGPITAEQRKQLTLVNQSGKHLRQLIDRILYVSRIDAGRVVYEPDWFDVNETMARVLDAVRPEAHGLELNAQSMQPSVRIFNDEAKLSEVLLNLVENAVKFTKQGKVELCCDCHEGMMEISVRDTGIGIKPQDVPLVFQPFRQLDSSMRRSYGGAGLGLYLSSKLLKLLHGTVRVNSEWGKGSVFTVTVPVEISCN